MAKKNVRSMKVCGQSGYKYETVPAITLNYYGSLIYCIIGELYSFIGFLAVLFVVLLRVWYTWILHRNFSRNTLETAVERNTLRMDTIYESMIGILEDDDFKAINVQDDRQATKRVRMNAHLAKPLGDKELLRVVSQCSWK